MMNKLELIKENAKLKYGIIELIEGIKNIKEYREIKKYLIEIVDGKEEKEKIDYEKIIKEWTKDE